MAYIPRRGEVNAQVEDINEAFGTSFEGVRGGDRGHEREITLRRNLTPEDMDRLGSLDRGDVERLADRHENPTRLTGLATKLRLVGSVGGPESRWTSTPNGAEPL